ncbi:MAG: hypothetical protein Q8L95_12875 [Burkholderiales bacterium]|nr:hypothetical protein [Burkholderiales bacterium]
MEKQKNVLWLNSFGPSTTPLRLLIRRMAATVTRLFLWSADFGRDVLQIDAL